MGRVPLWLTAAFLLVVLCTAVVTARHEAWSDEADTWLLMRDGGVRTMIARTGYMGTPALWYLAVAPLASSSLPFAAQQGLNLLFAWMAMALFVYKAPFCPLVKLAFLLSYFAAYEFSVIARPYALQMLLMFGIAALWPQRRTRPVPLAALVALLANVTVQGLVVAAAAGLGFLLETISRRALNRTSVGAMALMLSGGVAAVVQLLPPPDGQQVLRHFDAGTTPYAIGAILLPFTDPRISFGIALVLLLLVTLAAGRHLIPLIMMSAALVGLLLLYQFVWYGGVRHSGILLLVVIVGLWLSRQYEADLAWRDRAFQIAEVALAVGLALSIPLTLRYWRDDFAAPYSGSRETAAFIASHVSRDVVLAAVPTIQCESILAYLPGRRFWYAALGNYGSYMEWGRKLDQAQSRVFDPVAEARRRFGSSGWVLVSAGRLSRPEGLRLLFHSRTPFAIQAESYWIYEPVARPQ